MAITSRTEDSKSKSSKNIMSDEEDEPVKKAFPKTMKRKRDVKDDDDKEKHFEKKLDWIRAKAKSAIIPEESAAIVKPEYIFKEIGPLVIHLCNPCKQFNATRKMQVIDSGMVQIPLAMCTVCRGHFVQQRNLKFFQFELPNVKKEYYNHME